MPYINYADKELAFKIVYFGPGMGGKTTNLMRVFASLRANTRSEMVTLDTAGERTLFFDFLPLELGKVGGFSLRFNLFTVPGQIHYEASRKLILDGADGVVFVADSQAHMLEGNVESFRGMVRNLEDYGKELDKFPLVLQYNKRDADHPLPLGSLEAALGLSSPLPVFEAVATQGVGVMETIREVARIIVRQFSV